MEELGTTPIQIKLSDLIEMIEDEKISRRLAYIYNQIPKTNCGPCVKCCFVGAQVYPIEFLNIYAHLVKMPELTRTRLAKKLIEYEMLHLTTLDYSCAFLENDACILEDQKPIACRLFGFYAESEYKKMAETSRQQNQRLAMHFARNSRILLPEKVMTHDIEFCAPTTDKKGNPIFISAQERERLFQQIYSLAELVVPDEWLEPDHERFSYQFALEFMTAEEIEKAQTKIIKEFQAKQKSPTLEKLMAEYGVHI